MTEIWLLLMTINIFLLTLTVGKISRQLDKEFSETRMSANEYTDRMLKGLKK